MSSPPPKPSAIERLVGFALKQIDEADDAAAVERVAALRTAHPEWDEDRLAEHLIGEKCRQAAMVGAATSGAGLIPGLGTLAALTVGTVADVGATLKLQTELVLELAAVHRRRLTPDEKRRAVALVAGLSLSGDRLASRGGARLSMRLTERYAERWVAHAIPFAGVAASAGVDALGTYLVGKRAHAYFGLGPGAVGSWAESLRALTGVDERRLASWVGSAAGSAGTGMRAASSRVGAALVQGARASGAALAKGTRASGAVLASGTRAGGGALAAGARATRGRLTAGRQRVAGLLPGRRADVGDDGRSESSG